MAKWWDNLPIWIAALLLSIAFYAVLGLMLLAVWRMGLVGIEPDGPVCRARSWGICGQINSSR